MIRTIEVTDVAAAAEKLAAGAPRGDAALVEAIFRDVRRDGDAAVRRYERRFSGAAPPSLAVGGAEIREAFGRVSPEEVGAIRLAKARLERTESAVRSSLRDRSVASGGVRVSKRFVPIRSAGCYVPGGLARYASSVVMSVVPARVAGVGRIAVVSPPAPGGGVDPLTAVAASICGATEVYRAGGAQAIAALSVGTESIPRVDKIVGPGGSFVTLAKSVASRRTAIDMLAGPTELGIIADASADPRHVALDLVSQSEHGRDSRCFLITSSRSLASSVRRELLRLAGGVERGDIVRQSLRENGFVAVCRSQKAAADLAELLAPEHLQVMTRDPRRTAAGITSPGMVLLGGHTPSSASDYLLGSNHVLPTNGSGAARGSLSVLDFLKLGTEVTASRAALARISGPLRALARAEGLPNHYEAVRGRLR